MDKPRPVIAVNYYFGPNELNNRIFEPESTGMKAAFMKAFRQTMRMRGSEVVTLDTVDFRDPNVKYILYFDYNWRLVRSDPYLRVIPYEKRALVIIEPANINPSLYYTARLRDQFNIVFTWDFNLLRKYPAYIRINVPAGAEPQMYRENPFKNMSFPDKRLLVAVSMNRWSYMPQSTYPFRKRAYRYFERTFPEQFDLYGVGWNSPCIFYERWFGYPRFATWRGLIDSTSDAKVRKIAEYKFALCFENNASGPGYVSEKITDCFCARCVPIYYGCKEIEDMVPRDAWINMRDFRSFKDLGAFLCDMDEAHHAQYVAAIDRFMQSKRRDSFSTSHLLDIIADRLGFPVPAHPID